MRKIAQPNPLPLFYLHYQWRGQDAFEIPDVKGIEELVERLKVLWPEIASLELRELVETRLSNCKDSIHRIGRRATVLVYRRA